MIQRVTTNIFEWEDCRKLLFCHPGFITTTNKNVGLTSDNPQECQNHCRKTRGCKLFQWTPNQCYLKSKVPHCTKYEWYIFPNAIAGPQTCSNAYRGFRIRLGASHKNGSRIRIHL